MAGQLERLAEEYLDALDRLHRLREAVAPADWARRPAPGRWSVAECVAHLNLTSVACLPLLGEGLERAATLPRVPAGHRYRRGLLGWLLWRTMGPPARLRARTGAGFVPQGGAPPDQLVAEFERLQDRLMALLRGAEGLALDRVMVTSPFNARARYNLFAAFGIIVRHQHRHLWQAERAREGRA